MKKKFGTLGPKNCMHDIVRGVSSGCFKVLSLSWQARSHLVTARRLFMCVGPRSGGRLAVCLGSFRWVNKHPYLAIHAVGSSFPIILGQIRLTLTAPHGSLYCTSFLRR